jgi:lipopolysaccharide transport system ATP-binding protein
MNEIAISLKNISKCYKRYAQPLDRLKEILLPSHNEFQEFWALQNINLDVFKGETLGIVGQNGSGKSTLLQIIAGTLTPTTGELQVEGRISALLELGSGFNPEFTGRQNIFFNGQILGLSQEEILNKFDSIAAFAEIGSFIDRPVKTYSSGMVVRLAFAVVANIEPTILIVDEALAVGDAKFQARCMKRIRQLKEQGVTVLFVSHDASSVKMLCNRAVLINHGAILNIDSPKEVINHYIALLSSEKTEINSLEDLYVNSSVQQAESETILAHDSVVEKNRHGNKLAVIKKFKITDVKGRELEKFTTEEQVYIIVIVEARTKLSDLVVGISIRNLLGLTVYGTNTFLNNCRLPEIEAKEQLVVNFNMPCLLNKGIYTVTLGVHSEEGLSYDWFDDSIVFEVTNNNICDGIVDLRASIDVKVELDKNKLNIKYD